MSSEKPAAKEGTCGVVAGCFCGVCRACSNFIKGLSVGTVTIILRVLNLINAALLGVCCFVTFANSDGSAMHFFLSTYMGLFALLLFLFETRVPVTTPSIRRLFGFMFSFWGRTVFILFVGLICFGLVDACPTEPPLGPLCAWSYSLGFVTTVNAFFNCYILCSHPGFCTENQPDDMPTPEQLAAYLAAHPELRGPAASAGFGATPTNGDDSSANPSSNVPDWARGRTSAGNQGGAPAGANPFSTFSSASTPTVAIPVRSVAPSFDEGTSNPFSSSSAF